MALEFFQNIYLTENDLLKTAYNEDVLPSFMSIRINYFLGQPHPKLSPLQVLHYNLYRASYPHLTGSRDKLIHYQTSTKYLMGGPAKADKVGWPWAEVQSKVKPESWIKV